MAKPILFSKITRKSFDKLSTEKKKIYNYRILEDDGTFTVYIAGLSPLNTTQGGNN